ncbi:hypothetical protein GW17_00006318, partial [Ensete ventricosum]
LIRLEYPSPWPDPFLRILPCLPSADPSSIDMFARFLVALDDDLLSLDYPRSSAEAADAARVKDAMRQQCVPQIARHWFDVVSLYHSLDTYLAAAALDTMRRYVTWIDIALVANDAFVPLLFELILAPDSIDQLRAAAVGCVLAILQKRMDPRQKVALLRSLPVNRVFADPNLVIKVPYLVTGYAAEVLELTPYLYVCVFFMDRDSTHDLPQVFVQPLELCLSSISRGSEKKREKKNLEFVDPSPAGDYFSWLGEKERGDRISFFFYALAHDLQPKDMVDFLVLVNQLISKFSTSVEGILEEIFPAIASRLIMILSKDAFPSGPGCNTEVWMLKPSTKVFLHALNFSGKNAEVRELQELQRILYTFLHLMANHNLSSIFLAPNCRGYLDALMQLLLLAACSHKDVLLRKFLLKKNCQVPGFRSFIIEKFATNCCLYSVLDKSFEFHDANTVQFEISSYRAVHTGPLVYRYADRPLPGGTTKNRSSAVDFGHERPIEGEIDRRRSIEGDRRSEKKGRRRRRGEETEPLPSLPAGRPRAIAAHGSPACYRRPHSRVIFLPREETKRLPARGERSRRLFCSLDIYYTNYLTTYFYQQLLLFGEIVLAQKVMYEKLGSDFVIHFVAKGLQAAHCPHELTEQYYQKLQVQELC